VKLCKRNYAVRKAREIKQNLKKLKNPNKEEAQKEVIATWCRP
jgi:hypothetical protein